MTSGPWPTDPASAAKLLAILVCDIDLRTHEDSEDMLAEFLRAAWPTPRGQSQ
jgi:hypothetical protein